MAAVGEAASPRPTPAGAAALVALGGFLAGYAWTSEAALLYAAAYTAILQAAMWALAVAAANVLAGARVYRRVESPAGLAAVVVRAESEVGVPPALVRLHDALPSKAALASPAGWVVSLASRRLEWRYTAYLLPGRWCWGDPVLEVSDPLRLFTVRVRVSGRSCSRVPPRLLAAPHAVSAAAGLQLGRPRAARGFGTSFLYIRDYTPDDDPRFIEWKSTARSGRLTVKVFEREESANSILLVAVAPPSLEPPPGLTPYEYAVQAGAAAAQAITSAGLNLDLVYCGGGLLAARGLSRGSSIAAILSAAEPPLDGAAWGRCLEGLRDALAGLARRRTLLLVVGDREGVSAVLEKLPPTATPVVKEVEGPLHPAAAALELLRAAARLGVAWR